MKFVVVLGAILMTCLGRPVAAQVRMVDDTADVRIAVLNTILASRVDLLDGSPTVIAGCSLHGAEYYFSARANIDERFRKVLVRSENPTASGGCSLEDFADPNFRVLFFEEPKNAPDSATGRPEGKRTGREVVLHVIAGPDYRESTRYLVFPDGLVAANGRPQDTTNRYARWLVREFRLGGTVLHWADQPKKVVRMNP